MSDKRSVVAFLGFREGQQKFDYFITGLTGAIFAYVGQAYTPQVLGLDLTLIEPIAIILLAFSFFFGLKRIEANIQLMRLNHRMLDAQEKAGSITKAMTDPGTHGFNEETGEMMSAAELPAQRAHYIQLAASAERECEGPDRQTLRFYRLRNLFLFIGFLLLIAGKLAQPYIAGTP